MANEKRLIPLNKRIIYGGDVFNSLMAEKGWSATEAADFVKEFRTVDAVELPCRPGDHVFRLCGTKKHRYVGERIVSAVTLCGNGSWTIHSTADDALGKTVFLTHEEAEAALAKMDGDGND
jgi:hypothetical protein